jgi:hypothetical protein
MALMNMKLKAHGAGDMVLRGYDNVSMDGTSLSKTWTVKFNHNTHKVMNLNNIKSLSNSYEMIASSELK